MGSLRPLADYKRKIINLLLENDDFIKFMNPEPSLCDALDIIDVLTGGVWILDGKKYEEKGQIFDYQFVDDTVSDEKNYLFIETAVDYVRDNMFLDFSLYICVFSHKNIIRLTDASSPTAKEARDMGYCASSINGNRVDILCDIVDTIVNGTNKLPSLGEIQPSNRDFVSIYTPNADFYGKCLKYKITNYNAGGDSCGC